MEVVPDDERVSVRCNTDIDTMSLKAPMMSPVNMHKDYFYIPLRAILRENADLFITNPRTGDDIVPSKVNCLLSLNEGSGLTNVSFSNSLGNQIQGVFTRFNTAASTAGNSLSDAATQLRKFFLTYQTTNPLFSRSSLLNALGLGISRLVHGPSYDDGNGAKDISFDKTFEDLFAQIASRFKSFSVVLYDVLPITGTPSSSAYQLSSITYKVHTSLTYRSTDRTQNDINWRQFMELLKEYLVGPVTISDDDLQDGVDATAASAAYYYNALSDPSSTAYISLTGHSFLNRTYDYSAERNENALPRINISSLVAYQLACAQFYTSDAVDAVYTTELWHSNMRSLVNHHLTAQQQSYTLNGVTHAYDVVSSGILNYMVRQLFYRVINIFAGTYYAGDVLLFDYFTNLFNPQRSLKYRDYFVGAKTRPLAVGDVNVAVSNNQVNIIDVTKNIQMQRFLNQVNRIGRTLKEYSRGIFGQTPMQDPREVIWLGSTSDVIGAEETKNTGSAQLTEPQTITSQLRANSSRFAFEFNVAEFGWVIGITTFDVPRAYIDTTDRSFFHEDRFDMFNPYMQHIGDQEVAGHEILMTQFQNFGYQMRYSEYKQRTDRAVGAFVEFLPGYAFLADDQALGILMDDVVISPDFIRSRPYELDPFFISLTGRSQAAYFHFIVRQDYQVSASRPMEASPQIL